MTSSTMRRRPLAKSQSGQIPPSGWRDRVRRRWYLWLGGTLVLLAALAAVAVYRAPWFRVQSVEVLGATTSTQEQVQRDAAVPFDTPLINVDISGIERRVAALPQIADVTVSRTWPDSVTIRVVEATPVAAMRDGSSYMLISTDGLAYRSVSQRPQTLMLIANQAKALTTNPAAQSAAQVAVSIAASQPRVARSVDVIRAMSAQRIVVVLRNKTRVAWGSDVASATKAGVVKLLMQTNPAAPWYDVSSPQTPSVTPR